MSERGPDSLVIDFLGQLLADRLAGMPRPLAEYLALYPGQQQAVAAAWLEATRTGESGAGEAAADAAAGATGAGAPAARTVGPYELVRELGHGGQGSVWLARDERLGRRVALKLVPASPLLRDQAPRFRREAQAASRLDHPGLCAVYDVGTDGSVAWIAMRFVEGESLAQQLARGAVSAAPGAAGVTGATGATGAVPGAAGVERAVRLIEQAARALHVAHEAGIVHRDVKPANIMITPEGAPVVLDFGIARQEEDGPLLTLTGEALGTPAYMAPETLSGESRHVDRRADVWSLGVTLHELLAGRRPFEAPTREALVRAILDTEPQDVRALNRAVGRDLAVVLQTALARERDRRYQSALDLAEDLRRVRAHEPVSARPVGPVARVARWARRNRALAASLMALLLVLTGGLAVTGGLLASTRRTLQEKAQLLDDVTQLSDHKLTGDLLQAARALWPAVPERAADMRRWLGETAAVLGRRPRHEAALAAAAARLASAPAPWAAAAPSSAAATVTAPAAVAEHARAPAHATVTDAWFAEQLGELLGDLEALAAVEAGVRERLAFAESVERRTLEEPRAEWEAAIAAVAADPRFGGLALAPQRGLIPLGADPASGLQEFAHLQSGEPPRRVPATGALQLTADSAVVLVLVPGGTVRAGCEPPGPGRPQGSPHTDPQAGQYDGPVQTVELDPYFIGKHEVTQGQWLRHTGSNPSSYGPESKFTRDSEPLRHPVEAVSWIDADRVLRELGLLLPTEVQWERAARAGTTTVWWTGDDRLSVAGAANVADVYARANGGHAQWAYEDELDDGCTVHGPAGALRANAFGLHDTMGNVSEWCRDTWEDWSLSHPRPGDGYCHDKEQAPVFRGGAYNNGLHKARSGVRDGLPADVAVYWLGLRAARAVDGIVR